MSGKRTVPAFKSLERTFYCIQHSTRTEKKMRNGITVTRTENNSEFEFRLKCLAYISLSRILATLLCVNSKLDCVVHLGDG